MKKLVVLTMLCCTLFCVCAIASGTGKERTLPFITGFPAVDYTNPVSSTSVAVSGEVIIHLDTPVAIADQDSGAQKGNNEKTKVQTVIDPTGKKRKLKLGDVDISNKEIPISEDSSVEYAQVADGHYYLRREGERRYTLYCDKGDKVGRFWIDKWYYYQGCFKYANRYCIIVMNIREVPRMSIPFLLLLIFLRGELRKLRRIENLEEYDGREYTYQYDMTGDDEPVEGYEYRDYIMDGSRYYAKTGKEIRIFRENLKKSYELKNLLHFYGNLLYCKQK